MSTRIGLNKVLGTLGKTSIVLSTPVVSCSDPDSTAFLTAAGITDPVISNAICNLVVGLKTDGLWSQMTAIYPFVGGTATTHKYNLKDPRDLNVAYRLQFFGGWTHDSQGIKGNGLSNYADTFYAGSINTVGTYTPSDGSIGYGYLETISSCDDEGNCYDYPGPGVTLTSSNGKFACCNVYESLVGFYGQGLGQIGAAGYKNGIQISTNNGGVPVSLQSSIIIGAIRYLYIDGNTNTILSNDIVNFNSALQSFSYFSNTTLNAGDSAKLYARVQTFQTTLGRQVANLNVDPDAFVFLNNSRINDATNSATQINAINNLVIELKAQSLWNKITDIHPFITDTRNFIISSQNFTDTTNWVRPTNTIAFNNTLPAPDGSNTATRMQFSINGYMQQTFNSATSQTYTFSIYLRSDVNRTMQIGFVNPSVMVSCNVTTSWQRFTITHTFTGTVFPQVYNPTGTTFTNFEMWGAQLEVGSLATAYQAITGTPAGRISFQFTNNLKDWRMSLGGFSGGWTFSSTGAKPNGINAFVQSFRNFYNTFTAGNLHVSAYSRTAITPNANRSLWGSSLAFAPYNGAVQATFTNAPFNMNVTLGGLGINPVAMSNTQGLIMTTATSSGGGALRTYQNGVLKGTGSVSAGLPGSLMISAFNNNSSTTQYAPFELAIVTIGLGFTQAEAATFSNIITTYQTALSRNV